MVKRMIHVIQKGKSKFKWRKFTFIKTQNDKLSETGYWTGWKSNNFCI